MKSTTILSAILLVATVASASPPPAPAPPAAVKGKRPDVPAWHDRYDMPWEVVPVEVSFRDDETGRVFRRSDAAARKIATPDWKTRAGAAYPYVAWNSGSSGYSRTYLAKWEKGGDSLHSISLTTSLYTSASNAVGCELAASWAKRNGWRSSLGYAHRGGKSPHTFNLTLFHPTLTPKETFGDPSLGLRLSPGSSYFSATRRDGQLNARFAVSSRGEGDADLSPLEDIARYWKSPESFRDAALEELDRLESRARELITSGEAGHLWTLGGPTGGDPPMPVGRSSQISEKVKEAVLDEALAHVALRKKLVAEHFEEMYEAATSAFPPLMEVIEGEKER